MFFSDIAFDPVSKGVFIRPLEHPNLNKHLNCLFFKKSVFQELFQIQQKVKHEFIFSIKRKNFRFL